MIFGSFDPVSDERLGASDQRYCGQLHARGAAVKNQAMSSATAPSLTGVAASRSRLHEAGFSLLEVLVAIVVLSFGVLGVVGLQAAALQANKEARYQSSAVRLGRELSDLMRGNKDIAILTGAVNPYLQAGYTGTLPAAPEDCSTSACTSATTVAQFEIRDWLSRVSAELPGARVVVCFDSTPYTGAGAPQWSCTNAGGVAVVKMGWTRQSTNRSATGNAALERASTPSVILPLIAGSST